MELAGVEPASEIPCILGTTCLVSLYIRLPAADRHATQQTSLIRFNASNPRQGIHAISFGFDLSLIPVLRAEARERGLRAGY